jgi:hypothetical protein
VPGQRGQRLLHRVECDPDPQGDDATGLELEVPRAPEKKRRLMRPVESMRSGTSRSLSKRTVSNASPTRNTTVTVRITSVDPNSATSATAH